MIGERADRSEVRAGFVKLSRLAATGHRAHDCFSVAADLGYSRHRAAPRELLYRSARHVGGEYFVRFQNIGAEIN